MFFLLFILRVSHEARSGSMGCSLNTKADLGLLDSESAEILRRKWRVKGVCKRPPNATPNYGLSKNFMLTRSPRSFRGNAFSGLKIAWDNLVSGISGASIS